MLQRQTAVPCTLADIRDGRWVRQSELPSGVQTSRGLLSRVHVLGVIVEKRGQEIRLDDGTARVPVRSFDPAPKELPDVGALVAVIGKPREYGGEKYIALEICKRRSMGWVAYRKWELARVPVKPVAPAVAEAPVEVSVIATEKNPFERIVDRIRELDTGKGADVEEVLTGVPEGDTLLRSLLEEGEVFEIRPGKLKVLE